MKMKATTFQDKKILSQSKKDFRIVQVKIDKIIHLPILIQHHLFRLFMTKDLLHSLLFSIAFHFLRAPFAFSYL